MKTNMFLLRYCVTALVLLAVPAVVHGQFTFTTNDDSITITGYTGPAGVVVIPNATNGYTVTTIGDDAFYESTNLASVIIPNSVTNIGDDAFALCTNLTSAYFASNAPPNVGNAFYGDPVAIVYYLSGTTGWGPTFGGAPTTECTPPTAFLWSEINGSVTIQGLIDFSGYPSVVVIPNIIDGYAVTSIVSMEPMSPGTPSVTSVTIPSSVITIGTTAFRDFGYMTNVTIPDSVTSIEPLAFGSCSSLPSVTIPNSVTNIGLEAFSSCDSLTNISVEAANPSYSSLNGVLFDKAQDTLIQYPEAISGPYIIPNSVTSIGDDAFYPSEVTSVIIPNSVTNIGGGAFLYCSDLKNVTIPNSVTSIGDYAFSDCSSLSSAYFEGNAPPDDGTAFSNDSVTVYYLPGTMGWGPTFGGAPTELWNPQAAALYAAGGQFGFYITGPTNATIVVETCTNLANPVWLPVSTITLSASGTSSFSDAQSMNYPNRYYRFSAP